MLKLFLFLKVETRNKSQFLKLCMLHLDFSQFFYLFSAKTNTVLVLPHFFSFYYSGIFPLTISNSSGFFEILTVFKTTKFLSCFGFTSFTFANLGKF